MSVPENDQHCLITGAAQNVFSLNELRSELKLFIILRHKDPSPSPTPDYINPTRQVDHCFCCIASFRAASCSSCVSTSSAGSWTYRTTDPRMKQFFTDSCSRLKQDIARCEDKHHSKSWRSYKSALTMQNLWSSS